MSERIIPKIFLSYSWSNSEFAEAIDQDFKQIGITFQRDVRDVKYAESIKEFMQKIGVSDFVVMLISDNYIKSENCMYEVTELLNSFEYGKRILPVILPNADSIFSRESHFIYYNYWQNKLKDANSILEHHKNEKTFEDRKKIFSIYENLGIFFRTINDLKSEQFNVLKSANYKPILDRIGYYNDTTISVKVVEAVNTINLVDRLKDLEQFCYIVTHNLRAPIANILGVSQIISSDDITDDEKRGFHDALLISTKKLDSLVQDLNYILQVKYQPDNTDNEIIIFDILVGDVVNAIKNNTSEEFQVLTDFSTSNNFLGLKSYMFSVFYNLISNSIKFKKPQIKPVIEIKSYLEKDKLFIVFKDNGRGIDLTEYGERVFGLYKRFHPEIKGKGIGLYLTKASVEAMKGKISIVSEVNVGTEFLIEFNIS